jgi:hypothetical protein
LEIRPMIIDGRISVTNHGFRPLSEIPFGLGEHRQHNQKKSAEFHHIRRRGKAAKTTLSTLSPNTPTSFPVGNRFSLSMRQVHKLSYRLNMNYGIESSSLIRRLASCEK